MFGIASAIGLVWFRNGINDPRSPLAQFDLRAASAAARLAGESNLMDNLNSVGIRSMLVLGAMLVLAAIASGAFRSAALLALTMAAGGLLVEFLKLSPPRPLAALGAARHREQQLAQRSRGVSKLDRARSRHVVVGGRAARARRSSRRWCSHLRARRLQPRVPRHPLVVGGALGLARRHRGRVVRARPRPADHASLTGAAPAETVACDRCRDRRTRRDRFRGAIRSSFSRPRAERFSRPGRAGLSRPVPRLRRIGLPARVDQSRVGRTGRGARFTSALQ